MSAFLQVASVVHSGRCHEMPPSYERKKAMLGPEDVSVVEMPPVMTRGS
jgi:hypothetical protein